MATAILAPSIAGRYLDDGILASHPIYGLRPLLRGRIHQAAAVVSLPVGVHLVLTLGSAGTRLPAAAYAATCTLMFATSASYHR